MSPFNEYLKKKNRYSFNNSWNIDAPLNLIWDELINYKRWPDWCYGLEKIEPLDQFDHLEKGNNIRSIWKGELPYSISFDTSIKDFDLYSFLSFNITGDLFGQGFCYFFSSQGNTTINFIWNVSPTKLWMKMSSAFARSVFIDNHDQLVGQAISGFAQMIEQKIAQRPSAQLNPASSRCHRILG